MASLRNLAHGRAAGRRWALASRGRSTQHPGVIGRMAVRRFAPRHLRHDIPSCSVFGIGALRRSVDPKRLYPSRLAPFGRASTVVSAVGLLPLRSRGLLHLRSPVTRRWRTTTGSVRPNASMRTGMSGTVEWFLTPLKWRPRNVAYCSANSSRRGRDPADVTVNGIDLTRVDADPDLDRLVLEAVADGDGALKRRCCAPAPRESGRLAAGSSRLSRRAGSCAHHGSLVPTRFGGFAQSTPSSTGRGPEDFPEVTVRIAEVA